MIKAVFIDYTGTIIMQGGKDAEEMVYRVCKICYDLSIFKTNQTQMAIEYVRENYGDELKFL